MLEQYETEVASIFDEEEMTEIIIVRAKKHLGFQYVTVKAIVLDNPMMVRQDLNKIDKRIVAEWEKEMVLLENDLPEIEKGDRVQRRTNDYIIIDFKYEDPGLIRLYCKATMRPLI
jgi:hypothetical protein